MTDAGQADPAKSESIYKAVKRLLENNGLGRPQLEAIVGRVVADAVKVAISSWWTQRRMEEAASAEIREHVRKRVHEEIAAAIRGGTITVTIGPKP